MAKMATFKPAQNHTGGYVLSHLCSVFFLSLLAIYGEKD